MNHDTIKITKLDNSFIHIDAERSILQEISDYFTFFVEGYRFMPEFKSKMWDGKIRLLNLENNKLYAGLIYKLIKFADSRSYPVVFNQNSFTFNENFSFASDLATKCVITSNGKPIIPRDYQIEGVEHAIQRKRAVLLSPTASGKSFIIYSIIRHYLETETENVLLVVPTTSLVEQMANDFDDYSSSDAGFDAETSIHKIYSGKEKNSCKKRITVTTWQSIHRLPKAWFENYGIVIGDEVHKFKSQCLISIMKKCVNAEYRIGTTGTLDGSTVNELVLIGLFGPVKRVTTSRELMDRGDLANLNIQMVILKHSEENRKFVSKLDYAKEIDYLVTNKSRNNFLTNLAIDQNDGNTLILFNYIKHGKTLHEILENKNKDINRQLFYISGETAVDYREETRRITETQSNAIITASFGCFSTGINIKNLHYIIFAVPSKSQIRVLQSIGRGLRKSDNGMETVLFDIGDDCSWGKRKNYSLKHAGDRIKIYTKERFKFKLFEINFV